MRRNPLAAMLAITMLLTMTGCGTTPPTPTPPSTSTDTGTGTTPTAPVDNSPQIADDIQRATATAIPLGLMVIPDQAEATQVATLADQVIKTNILPILNGDPAGLVAAIPEILSLNAFNDPKLAKIKMLLEAALPFATKYIPPEVLNGTAGKIPPNVKLYLLAFFNGAHEGLSTYLGTAKGEMSAKDFKTWAELRAKLTAPPAK